MADDITLTVRVRDLSRGDFQRLDRQLDRMRRDLQGVRRDTDSAGMHSRRLGQDIDKLGQKFKQMQQSGNLSRRELTQMSHALDGMSRSALNAARSGEITHDRFHSLNSEIGSLRAQLTHLGRDLDGNTNALRRNNNQSRTTVRMVNGVVQSVRTATRSIDGNTNVINTWRNETNRTGNTIRTLNGNGTVTGKVFGNMRAKLIGLAVVLGASLLPTIGALAPMLAGIAGVVGVAALAFSGLSKPTKQLSKDEKDFLKGLKPLNKEFKELQATARKAVLPGLTKSFDDVGKAMKSLNPVVKVAGKGLTDLVQKAARGISSKSFMGPFLENVKMGTAWLQEFAGSFGTFLKEFFAFGAKSKPALDAWQDLLGGFLDRGLPGMFKNMESGIKGSSEYLSGLSAVINDGLLPGLGRLLGKFMEVFGPTLGDMLKIAAGTFMELADIGGKLMVAFGPVLKLFMDIGNGMANIGRIGFGTLADTMGALGTALAQSVSDAFGGPQFSNFQSVLTAFSTWVKNNEPTIRGFFTSLAHAIINAVDVGITMMPKLMTIFSVTMDTIMISIGNLISSLAVMFGDLPIIGPKLKAASKNFNDFYKGAKAEMDKATIAAGKFAAAAHPNLQRAQLVIDVDEAKRNLEDIKAQLRDPDLTKERKAKLTADKKAAEDALAKAKAALSTFDNKRASAKLDANNAPFFGKLGAANGARLKNKSAAITARTDGFWAGIRSIAGKVLGTSYINVQMRKVESQNAPKFSANGNVFRHFANGGTERHDAQIGDGGTTRVWNEPETGGESYIPLGPSKRTRSRQIAATTVGILGGRVEWFAKGGLSKKQKAQAASEKSARNEARGDLTISHFGKMAGYKNDEFKKALGLPDALGGLVDSLNHWRSVILKSTHGAMEKSLLKQLDKAGKSLIKYEKSLSKVEKSLDKAKTKLDDLKQAAASLRESVTSGVMSATDITQVANGGDKNITVSDIMTQMTQNRDKSSAFASSLKQLQKKGVSKEIIEQIAQAGISGGGLETAGALLGASSSEIKSINDMQKQINANAKSAGNTAADAMYGAGIKAAQGLVDGLTKKKKDIEKAMMNIAKAMEKSIKKALGIKSPSRVMMQVGHHTAEGFALGIAKNRKVPSAWSSMLNTGPSGGVTSGGGGGAEVIQLVIGNKVFDEIVLDSNRRTVRTHGGNVQAVYGRRTG